MQDSTLQPHTWTQHAGPELDRRMSPKKVNMPARKTKPESKAALQAAVVTGSPGLLQGTAAYTATAPL